MGTIRNEGLELFSDGVFAIILTLLVLDCAGSATMLAGRSQSGASQREVRS